MHSQDGERVKFIDTIGTICNSTFSYTCKMQVYTGKDIGLALRENNEGLRVVLDLVEDIKKY